MISFVRSIATDVFLTQKEEKFTIVQPKAARKNFYIQAYFLLVEMSSNVYKGTQCHSSMSQISVMAADPTIRITDPNDVFMHSVNSIASSIMEI